MTTMQSSSRISLTKYKLWHWGYYSMDESIPQCVRGHGLSPAEWCSFCNRINTTFKQINRLRLLINISLLATIVTSILLWAGPHISNFPSYDFLLVPFSFLSIAMVLAVFIVPSKIQQVLQRIHAICDEETSFVMNEVLEGTHIVFRLKDDDETNDSQKDYDDKLWRHGFRTYHTFYIEVIVTPKMEERQELDIEVAENTISLGRPEIDVEPRDDYYYPPLDFQKPSSHDLLTIHEIEGDTDDPTCSSSSGGSGSSDNGSKNGEYNDCEDSLYGNATVRVSNLTSAEVEDDDDDLDRILQNISLVQFANEQKVPVMQEKSKTKLKKKKSKKKEMSKKKPSKRKSSKETTIKSKRTPRTKSKESWVPL